MKLPFMQFYVDQWLSEAGLRGCGYAARGLWADLLCFMWKSGERGVLLTGRQVWGELEIAQATGGDPATVQELLNELLGRGVTERREDGALICRRMVREEKERCQARQRKQNERSRSCHGDVTPDISEVRDQSTEKPLTPTSPPDGGLGVWAKRMFEFYNEHRGPLPLAMQLTKERQAKCEARIRSAHNDLAGFFRQWQAAVVKAASHPWPSWKPDFGYLIANDTNYLKVLEGKYDGWTDNAATSGGVSRQLAAVQQRQNLTTEALRTASAFARSGPAKTQRALPPADDDRAGGDVHGSPERPVARRD